MFSNELVENSLLSGIIKYGYTSYLDAVELVNSDCFSSFTNKIIFDCIGKIYNLDNNSKIDMSSIMSATDSIGYRGYFDSADKKNHLLEIFAISVEKENIVKFAGKLKKINIAKQAYLKLDNAKHNLVAVTGDENINDILNYCDINIEECFQADISAKHLADGTRTRMAELIQNPVKQVGISTGYPIYDYAIGGGLRGGSVNVLGARAKVGKSTVCTNIAYHVSSNLDIPVLYLDTELRKEEQEDRILARISQIDVNLIGTGQFAGNQFKQNQVIQAISKLENIPYYHLNIAGMSFEAQLNAARQWIIKKVGVDQVTGRANKCVIIYDYLKLMSDDSIKSMQEYQALGFMMTQLHNFAVKYDLPIFATVQINREGIDKDSSGNISGSDRILWLCTNYTVFRNKTEEEINIDPLNNGNKKLIVLDARHGPGLDYRNYINMKMNGSTCTLVEGKTMFEVLGTNDD